MITLHFIYFMYLINCPWFINLNQSIVCFLTDVEPSCTSACDIENGYCHGTVCACNSGYSLDGETDCIGNIIVKNMI